MVVVATRLDASSERIITYLNEHAQLSINAMFFAAFADGGNRYLSLAWMIDPDEPSQPVARKARKEPWNGEFYASFGPDYSWEDALAGLEAKLSAAALMPIRATSTRASALYS